jgi:hypothetical protein
MKPLWKFTAINLMVILFAGCVSFNSSRINFNYKPLKKKLPPLEMIIEYFPGSYPTIQSADFSNQMISNYNNNLVENGENFKGYIVWKYSLTVFDFNGYWMIPSCLTFFMGNLIGLPFFSYHQEMELTCTILDENFNTLVEYKATADDTEYSAIFWGNPIFGNSMVNTAQINALEWCLVDIFGQINSNMDSIIEKLNQGE